VPSTWAVQPDSLMRSHEVVAVSMDASGRFAMGGQDKTAPIAKGTEGGHFASLVELPQALDFVPDLTVGEEAGMIVQNTHSGGLVTLPRLMATANLALKALSVPGDFVQTGVYTGGTSVLMANVLKSKNSSRRLWAADSFAGLPSEDQKEIARQHDQPELSTATLEGEKLDQQIASQPGWFSATRMVFEKNLEANGLGNSTTNPQIKVLQGWFNDTLPNAPIEQISFLQLDGDIYVSTMDALTSLYDKVVPGGYIYVDDYGSFIGCKHAVDDFREQRGIAEVMYPISECGSCGRFTALWWRKEPERTLVDRFSKWFR